MTTPGHIIRLMQYVSLARSFKLGEEDAMAVEFANDLRAAALEGRLCAVFCHVPNELAGITRVTSRGRRAEPKAALAKALGLITGCADYLFLWNGGSCALEAKSPTGSMTRPQRDFRDWCRAQGVPHHVFRTVREGLAILEQYNILEPRP